LIRSVLRGVCAQKLQNLLALVTMSVGAFAMAATLLVGVGAIENLWRDMDALMGSQVIVAPEPAYDLMKKRASEAFTSEDLAYLQRSLPDAKYVMPFLTTRTKVSSKTKTLYLSCDGITPDVEDEPLYHPLEGSLLSKETYDGQRYECLLTRSAAAILGIDLAEGNIVRLNAARFRVVGITNDPPDSGPGFETRLITSYSAMKELFGAPFGVGLIVVGWRTPQDMETVTQTLVQALDACRGPGTYDLSCSQFRILRGKQLVRRVVLFGTILAFFCVVVSAVGIFNVMLSSVVRRTYEFAVRITMGASRNELGFIVLLEGGAIGLAGGLLGVLAAWLTSPLICRLVNSLISTSHDLAPLPNTAAFAIPLVTCCLAALVAGFLPALRVSRIDILSQLRER